MGRTPDISSAIVPLSQSDWRNVQSKKGGTPVVTLAYAFKKLSGSEGIVFADTIQHANNNTKRKIIFKFNLIRQHDFFQQEKYTQIREIFQNIYFLLKLPTQSVKNGKDSKCTQFFTKKRWFSFLGKGQRPLYTREKQATGNSLSQVVSFSLLCTDCTNC